RRFSGYKFRRQQPIDRYTVDFVCYEKRLVIELDGGQHTEREAYDRQRDEYLMAEGFRVLRFWNNTVFNESDGVQAAVWNALEGIDE
ncbi:MAG: DUF559 domain-containing protein, partial [Candidatus Poribacteria bacterium]|nr:DUF559 domain-containing protein [Candidatus Poribacteria bacterium]